MPREFADGVTAAEITAAVQRREQQLRGREQEATTGRPFAYRMGSCCAHTRIRHRNCYPMDCSGVVYTGDVQPDGEVAEEMEPCRCPGWREMDASGQQRDTTAAGRQAGNGSDTQM